MPLIGIGEECQGRRGAPTNCPIRFKDQGDVKSFEGYKKFVQNQYHKYLCAVFGDDNFSPSFQEELLKVAKINFDLEETCSKEDNLFKGHKGRIPSRIKEHALKQFLKIGNNPRLKKIIRQKRSCKRYEFHYEKG